HLGAPSIVGGPVAASGIRGTARCPGHRRAVGAVDPPRIKTAGPSRLTLGPDTQRSLLRRPERTQSARLPEIGDLGLCQPIRWAMVAQARRGPAAQTASSS